MRTIYVVWEHGGSYEPSYIVEVFSTLELAEAWMTLHNVNGSHSVGEMTFDTPEALALIERGTRPWSCAYYYVQGEEWDPAPNLHIEAINPVELEKEPSVYKHLDRLNRAHESWDVTVIALTAEEARESAAAWITLWSDLGLGEAKDGQ